MVSDIAQECPRCSAGRDQIIARYRGVDFGCAKVRVIAPKVSAKEDIERLSCRAAQLELRRADVLPGRKTTGAIKHQLLRDVAESFVQPHLLVDARCLVDI